MIAVTGTNREASVLRGLGVKAIAGGGSPERLARVLAERARGASGIISFGMAGALDPALRIGDWVIASGILSPSPSGEGLGWSLSGSGDVALNRQAPPPTPPLKGRGFEVICDQRWIDALVRQMPAARLGPVYADGRLIADPDEKLDFGRQGALAADMESHIAAAAAEAVGAPFAILRCISDEAHSELPPAIAVAMKPDGGLALGAIFGSILKNPAQLPELLRTTAKFNKAFATLRDGAIAVGTQLAFDRR